MGFGFPAADGIHCGYAQVTVNDLNSAVNPLDLTIGTVAYNTTPGQAITIARVPEPTSPAVVCPTVAVVMLSRRRRSVALAAVYR